MIAVHVLRTCCEQCSWEQLYLRVPFVAVIVLFFPPRVYATHSSCCLSMCPMESADLAADGSLWTSCWRPGFWWCQRPPNHVNHCFQSREPQLTTLGCFLLWNLPSWWCVTWWRLEEAVPHLHVPQLALPALCLWGSDVLWHCFCRRQLHGSCYITIVCFDHQRQRVHPVILSSGQKPPL